MCFVRPDFCGPCSVLESGSQMAQSPGPFSSEPLSRVTLRLVMQLPVSHKEADKKCSQQKEPWLKMQIKT
jgi:hypothetical protein